MAKELNETFPGIEAVNDFYTPYYMKEYNCSIQTNVGIMLGFIVFDYILV